MTVRRQGIVHLERFTMRSSSMALKVKLDDTLVPNAEIAVTLVGSDVRANQTGDPDPSLPKMPAFANGSSSVKVTPNGRTLGVTVAAQKPTLEPGGATNIDVDIKDPSGKPAANADVALVVADEAILALSAYKTPDPVAFFYADRPVGVTAFTVRDSVLLADPDVAKLQATQPTGNGAPGAGYGRGLGGIGGGAGRKSGDAPPPPMMAPVTASKSAPSEATMQREEAPNDSFDKKKESGGKDDRAGGENKNASVSRRRPPSKSERTSPRSRCSRPR